MVNDHTLLSFRDVCIIFASTGNSELYQRVVAEVQLTPREQLYLHSWQLSDSEEEPDWSHAVDCLIEMEVAGCEWYLAHEKRLTTFRKRRPWAKWFLGNAARELGVESDLHYRQALSLLNVRRMNDPWLRIQVLCDLGQTHQVASPPQAHLLYEQALGLCIGECATHPALAALHEGLLWTNQQMGQYTDAVRHGELAVQLQQDEKQRARVWELLGEAHLHAASYKEAVKAYHQMHRTAEGLQECSFLARSLMGLAQVHLTEGQSQQARAFCLKALEIPDLPSPQRGKLFQMCAKVAHVQAAQSANSQPFRQEAVACYLKALALLGRQANLLGSLADLLEEMVAQEPTVIAQLLWQQAYAQLWESNTKKAIPHE